MCMVQNLKTMENTIYVVFLPFFRSLKIEHKPFIVSKIPITRVGKEIFGDRMKKNAKITCQDQKSWIFCMQQTKIIRPYKYKLKCVWVKKCVRYFVCQKQTLCYLYVYTHFKMAEYTHFRYLYVYTNPPLPTMYYDQITQPTVYLIIEVLKI